jgi:ABC-type transporter Mla subunit MlaD
VETTGHFEAVTEAELVRDEHESAAAEPAAAALASEFDEDASGEPFDSGLHSDTGLRLLKGASGLRPSPAALMARLEAAMAASARTEAALGDLLRTAKFLSASIGAVRNANAELVRELEVICSVVDGAGAERAQLERRILRLERVLEETAREASSERQYLVEDHDAFIATLVTDHERELARLRERLSHFSDSPGAPDPSE